MTALEPLRASWFIACRSRDVRDRPVARTVLGVPVVLFRTRAGVSALLDRCPHRNRALSDGTLRDGVLRCAYHGWAFDARGRCCDVPGLAENTDRAALHATAFPAAERDGWVWVLPAGDQSGLRVSPPALLPPDAASFARVPWTVRIRCDLADAVENVLDPAHPHYVHGGILRTPARRPTEVTVRRAGDQIVAEYRGDAASAGWLPRLLEGERGITVARYLPPATARLEYRGARGLRFAVGIAFTPRGDGVLDAHALIAVPRSVLPDALVAIALRALFAPVVRQDVWALERQQRNLARFGAPAYASTALDIMRPHILAALRPTAPASSEPFERRFTLEL